MTIIITEQEWILTPKNLYRVLTGKGGYSIFPQETLYGLTLVKFWREMLEDTLSDEILDRLFPTDGTHPRIQSNLMNRTGSNPVPGLLIKGFHEQSTNKLAIGLIHNCMQFLTQRSYNPTNYRRKMDQFEASCTKNDSIFTKTLSDWLISVRQFQPGQATGNIDPYVFTDSLRLAADVLLCLFGPQMGGEEIRRIRTDPACSAESLWEKLNWMTADSDPRLVKAMFYPEGLTERAMNLIRLMALLPEENGMDILEGLRKNGYLGEGADESLNELKEKGYAGRKGLWPTVRGTLRMDEFSCDEWPEVWKYWAEEIRKEPMDEKKQELFSLAQSALEPITAEGLNRDGLVVLTALEGSAMTRKEELTADWMPSKHREWLEIHEHTKTDEIDCRIMAELWAILKSDTAAAAEQIAALSKYDTADLQKTENYELLCNVLEIGGKCAGKKELDELFARLLPEEPQKAAVYYTFLGGKQRSIDKQPAEALKSLRNGRQIIEQLQMEGTTTEAANDTRTAYALADLHRWEETLPLMERVMTNLKSRGYSESSHTWQVTRDAYLYFQGQCKEKRDARAKLEQELKKTKNRENIDYLQTLANYTDLLTEAAIRGEAEKRARETIVLCRKRTDYPGDVAAYSLRIAGEALLANGHESEALGLFTEAEILSRQATGTDTPETLRCKADMAATLVRLDRPEAGRKIMDQVMKITAALYPEQATNPGQYRAWMNETQVMKKKV